MSISRKHKVQLETALKSHELILQIGRDPKIRSALTELAHDEKLRQKVEDDPEAWIKEEGIELPKGSKVTLTHSKAAFDVHITVSWNGGVSVGYSSDRGFYAEKNEK